MAEAARKEAATESVKASAVAASKKKGDWLVTALVALVAVNFAGLATVGYFLKHTWTRLTEIQNMRMAPAAEESAAPQLGKELQPQTLGVLVPIEGFLVNIPSEQGMKFLQMQMELELSDPAVEDEVSRKKPAIRDAVIVLLSAKSYNQLREPNGLRILRADILKSINHLLTTGRVKEVFFTQFHFN